MILETLPVVRQLSQTDKLQLVTELWDDLAASPEEIPVPPELLDELDRRLAHFRQSPDDVSPWEDVRARLLASRSDGK